MVNLHSRYVTALLPSGNLLVADVATLPQDLYIIKQTDFLKFFAGKITSELNTPELLKHKASLSPDIDFTIERFAVSSSSNICAVGRHCLAILQPIGDFHGSQEINPFIFRCFPVCRYAFHTKSSLELVHVSFVTREKEFLSILSTDCNLRLFDATQLTPESLLAPFRSINLIYPSRTVASSASRRAAGSANSSSRISLAKCEPFVSVAFLDQASIWTAVEVTGNAGTIECSNFEASMFLPFAALRSNGDVYFGFADVSCRTAMASPSRNTKPVYDCNLAGPLKVHYPDGDLGGNGKFSDLNACSMHIVSGERFAKGAPLLIIASSDGSIGHYLMMQDTESENDSLSSTFALPGAKSKKTLYFPTSSLYGVERIKITGSSHHATEPRSLTSWLYDTSCVRIFPSLYDKTFSYVATASSSVFRVTLPWLEVSQSVSESAFVARIGDDPTFVESLLSVESKLLEPISVALLPASYSILIAVGSSLYIVPNGAKAVLRNEQELSNITDDLPVVSVTPSQGLFDSMPEEVLPPSEDFVAVIQRALARQANLNPKLLSDNLGDSKDSNIDDQISHLYAAATGAVSLLAQEYFGRTDTAARQLSRLHVTCDARLSHVTSTLEKRLSKSCAEFGSQVVPSVANRIDHLADRLSALVQRLSKLSEISRSKSKRSNVLEEACIQEGITDKLSDIEVNMAHINTLYGEVDEKAAYLATQIASFAERDLQAEGIKVKPTVAGEPSLAPTSLMPLFETLGLDIKRIADDLRHVKDEVDIIDSRVKF